MKRHTSGPGSRRRKTILFLIARLTIMAIITTEVLAACGVNPAEKESRAKAALERKYQKEFEITQVYPQKFGELYYEVQAYAVEDPQMRFVATIDTEDERISDTYVERRVCAAIAQQAAENLDKLPGYYYVFVHAGGPQPIADDPKISIRDYAQLDSYNRFQIHIYMKPERADSTSVYESLKNVFSGMEYLTGSVRLYVVNEDQMESVQAYFDINDDVYSDHMELTKKFFTLDVSYNEGIIAMDESDFVTAVRDVI